MATIQFLGATETVTGSKYLVRTSSKNILVDCGMFQGVKSLRLRNWQPFPIEPSQIDAVVLTHAHIDHSGMIPRLVKDGFRGRVFATPATKELCQILLPDAGYLAEEEADYLNRHKRSKHSPALPLYTFEDGRKAIEHFVGVPFDQDFVLDSEVSFRFYYAGHILGAASVVLNLHGLRVGFSGDIGRPRDSIFYPPQLPTSLDYLITESTYGNRIHQGMDPAQDLEKIICRTIERGGTVVIPSFAVGRAQAILHILWGLRKAGRIPGAPVYLNSPMATDVNEVWKKYHDLHRLSPEECAAVCGIARYVRTMEESKSLNEDNTPKILISASGMISGGRVLHHIKKFGPDPKSTIVLAGFQSAGTRGEAIRSGANEIKVHGEYVPIRAEVAILDNVSAHADSVEILNLYAQSKLRPKQVFVTHGEPAAADELRRRLTERLGWNCVVPALNQKVELD